MSLESYVENEAQALVGKSVSEVKKVISIRHPAARFELDFPGGPMKRRAPDPNRVIIEADSNSESATTTAISGHFS